MDEYTKDAEIFNLTQYAYHKAREDQWNIIRNYLKKSLIDTEESKYEVTTRGRAGRGSAKYGSYKRKPKYEPPLDLSYWFWIDVLHTAKNKKKKACRIHLQSFDQDLKTSFRYRLTEQPEQKYKPHNVHVVFDRIAISDVDWSLAELQGEVVYKGQRYLELESLKPMPKKPDKKSDEDANVEESEVKPRRYEVTDIELPMDATKLKELKDLVKARIDPDSSD